MTASDTGTGAIGSAMQVEIITRKSKVVGYAYARMMSMEKDAETEHREW